MNTRDLAIQWVNAQTRIGELRRVARALGIVLLVIPNDRDAIRNAILAILQALPNANDPTGLPADPANLPADPGPVGVQQQAVVAQQQGAVQAPAVQPQQAQGGTQMNLNFRRGATGISLALVLLNILAIAILVLLNLTKPEIETTLTLIVGWADLIWFGILTWWFLTTRAAAQPATVANQPVQVVRPTEQELRSGAAGAIVASIVAALLLYLIIKNNSDVGIPSDTLNIVLAIGYGIAAIVTYKVYSALKSD